MQTMFAVINGAQRTLRIPDPREEVLPGIRWGAFDALMTPAYWRGQAWQHNAIGNYRCLRLGRTLAEETAACLLGGYGMPAELGLQAYSRLRLEGVLDGTPSAGDLERILAEPLTIHGKIRRYRFPRQKARYLSACLAAIDGLREPECDVELRDLLAGLPGIGLKTSSWIVRNHRGSDQVAVLDVHILRACRHIGLFEPAQEPGRHYRELERAFLAFARAISTPAGMLDGLIWDYMRQLPTRGARSTQCDLFGDLAA